MFEPYRRFLSKLGRTLGKDPGFPAQMMGQQPPSTWCLDNLRIEGDSLVLDGWALAPAKARPALTANGVRLSGTFGRPRPDLERLMSFDRRAPTAGFHVEHDGISQLFAERDCLEIQFCEETTLRPFNTGHSFYWPLNPPGNALPDPDRRRRVHGDTNEDGFIINGYSTFRKLSYALGGQSRKWDSFRNILDWGCGCGRVFRYFPPDILPRLSGADIDADSIDWCERNFSSSRFNTVALLPPTALPDAHFDLVVGISVFTHLREQPQNAWLRELSRIVSSKGLLLVTIHGPAAAGRANLSEEQYHEWMDRGFVATGLNVDLRGTIPDDSYYVDSMHTHEYVRREWGKYFRILKIYDGYIANHQDLVVMRKR